MRRHRSHLVKVVVFVLVTSLISAAVAVTFGRIKFQDSTTYSAVFEDVSGLQKGVDVRAAGVSVGSVSGLRLRPDGLVRVTFDVPDDMRLTTRTAARVRYANLTGDRYLDLTDDTASRGRPLPPRSTIPASRTTPALDLDALYSGFQPLLQALSPSDVNELTGNLIAVTEGQGDAVESLLAHVASFTTTLAERDELVGSVIDNLNRVLGTVDARRDDLDDLVTGLDELVGGLARDRRTIGTSLAKVDRLAGDTAGLLSELRPGLRSTTKEVDRFASLVNDDADFVVDVFRRYHDAIISLGRGGAYGSFFNFYLCGVRVKFSDAGSGVPIYSPWVLSHEKRCT